jgi:DNA-directed RNA polymerase subunit F
MDVISEKLVTDAEAKRIIEARKKEVEELKYVQKNTLGILKKFIKIDPKKAEELIAELQKIEKLRERHIISIVNTLPQDTDDLRTVLQKEYSSLSDEEVGLILQAIKKIS